MGAASEGRRLAGRGNVFRFLLFMKNPALTLLAMGTFFAASLCAPAKAADTATKASRPAIYDESADGAKQIADALVVAKKENKRVLLQFGANWCGWCHKLHKLFESDTAIAVRLKES